MQKQKEVVNVASETGFDLKKASEALQTKKTPATRVVKVKYRSCCGCGCSTQKLTRNVPYDSPIQDGEFVDTLEPGDARGW